MRMPEEKRRVSFQELSGVARGLSALVGMSGLVVGGIAVFETANQAGTVGLLTVGGLSGLIALLGKVPLRWTVGGAEVDMSYDETIETADALADLLTPEQLEELSRRLLTSAETPATLPSPHQLRLASTIERASEAERRGHGRLSRLAGLLGPDWSYAVGESFEMSPGRGFIPDGVLRAPEGVKIGLDFKAWGTEMSASRLHSILARSRKLAAETSLDAILIMVDSEMPREFFPVPRSINSENSDSLVGFATFGDSRSSVEAELERLRRAGLKRRESDTGPDAR